MAVKKTGLGKGLSKTVGMGIDSVIAKKEPSKDIVKEPVKDKKETKIVEKVVEKVVEVEKEKMLRLSEIEPNREQPRKYFDEEGLTELADSIKQHGIIEPLIVSKQSDYYEIIAGERRWRAAKMAGLREVPVIVRDYSDQEVVEISLIENLQREDLNPIEEAWAYQRLSKEFGLKQEEVAAKVSKDRTTISNALRLLNLDINVQSLVAEGALSGGHARALLSLDKFDQYKVAKLVIDDKMSVRETESYVKKYNSNKAEKASMLDDTNKKKVEMIYRKIEDNLNKRLGTKVVIKNGAKDKGKIELSYYSRDEFERIIKLLESIKN